MLAQRPLSGKRAEARAARGSDAQSRPRSAGPGSSIRNTSQAYGASMRGFRQGTFGITNMSVTAVVLSTGLAMMGWATDTLGADTRAPLPAWQTVASERAEPTAGQSQRLSPPPVLPLTSLSETRRPPAVPPRSTARTNEVALPFDAVLNTILVASDRKAAIIDGRIVQVGDVVRGARITEIAPRFVLLRDGRGRLRQLAQGASR